MIIGVPTEIKSDERRVALTPAGAAGFRHHGHTVVVQRGAGVTTKPEWRLDPQTRKDNGKTLP